MKRLIVFAMLGIAIMAVTPAKAQVSVSVNIGSQPNWGPRGYNYVDYYYLTGSRILLLCTHAASSFI